MKTNSKTEKQIDTKKEFEVLKKRFFSLLAFINISTLSVAGKDPKWLWPEVDPRGARY